MRPSKDEYYLNIAKAVSLRGTCIRTRGGAVIVKDDQIIATGYIGAPRKIKDCFERNKCLRMELDIPHGQRYEMCRSVHAEMNAIINAARAGTSLLGGTMYLYTEDNQGEKIDCFPCFICKKMIINAGLDKFIGSTREGMQIFKVQDWISEWQEKDMIDDQYQYGKDQNIKKI